MTRKEGITGFTFHLEDARFRVVKAHAEHSRSITGFTEVSSTRQCAKRKIPTLKLSLEGFYFCGGV